jgi:hypothetical protein
LPLMAGFRKDTRTFKLLAINLPALPNIQRHVRSPVLISSYSKD